jgi:hypothetical protein
MNRAHEPTVISDTLCHASDELTTRGKVHPDQAWRTARAAYESVGSVHQAIDDYVHRRLRTWRSIFRIMLWACIIPLGVVYTMCYVTFVFRHTAEIATYLELLPVRYLPRFLVGHHFYGASGVAVDTTAFEIEKHGEAVWPVVAAVGAMTVGGAVAGLVAIALLSVAGACASASSPVMRWDFVLDANHNIRFEDSTFPTVTGAYRLNSFCGATTCLGCGDEDKLGAHCVIAEKWGGLECFAGPSKGATLLGWTTHPAYVLRKCACNAHNALCHRHGTKQHSARRSLAGTLADFIAYLRPAEGAYAHHPMRVFENWLRKWAEGKQRSILKSREWDEMLPGKVKAMVKREVNHKRPTKARLIQFYVNLMTQSAFGPAFYALQKTLCEVLRNAPINDRIDVTFASGMTAQQIGEWMETTRLRGAVCYYERDGKNWDASMQKPHAEFRAGVYEVFDRDLADFARKCNVVKGTGVFPGHLLRYAMKYTVKSGHNDTTLGNSLINAAIAYASLNLLKVEASVIVAGDDLLVACYQQVSCDALKAIEADFGIQPEARVLTDYRQTTFISGMWISDGVKIGFVPIPGRLFARLWWTVKPPGKKSLKKYLRGVARGMQQSCGTIPLVRVLLSAFDSSGDSINSMKGFVYRNASYCFGDGIWLSLALRYSLPVVVLREFEEWLKSLPPEPLLLVHPVLARIAEVDLSDISDRGNGLWPEVFSG